MTVANDLNSTWISSLASYWGGIIGGIFSGLLAVIGVILTIKYYRDSDTAKIRISHMPFLYAEIKSCAKSICKEGLKTFKTTTYTETKNNDYCYFRIQIKNIGKGFASILTINTDNHVGGIAFKKLIQVDKSEEFCLKIRNKDISKEMHIKFSVQFIDCMTNEYIQTYTLIYNDKKLYFDSGYPIFIGQTHNIGNI